MFQFRNRNQSTVCCCVVECVTFIFIIVALSKIVIIELGCHLVVDAAFTYQQQQKRSLLGHWSIQRRQFWLPRQYVSHSHEKLRISNDPLLSSVPMHDDHADASRTQKPWRYTRNESVSKERRSSRNMTALSLWAESNGISFDSKQIRLFQEDDDENELSSCWGVTAIQNITKNTVLVKVPSELVLSSEKIQKELLCDGMNVTSSIRIIEESNFQDMIPQFYLVLKLLIEIKKGSDSRWYDWMQSLPSTFDTAIYMDDIEVDCLPPFAYTMAETWKRQFDVFVKAIQRITIPNNSTLDIRKYDVDTLRWAFNVVFTRCWCFKHGMKERCDLVPIGDMFNHGVQPNIDIDYDECNNVVVSLKDDAAANQPLLLCYGKPTNPYRYMIVFGFVDTSQNEIFCQLMLSGEPTLKHYEMGYDPSKMTFRTSDGAISNDVFDFVLYSILEQLPDVQEQFYQAKKSNTQHLLQEIRTKYHLETCISVKKHIDRTIKEMDELLVRIHSIQQDDTEELHPRLGLIRKNNEFITSTFRKAKKSIDEMIQLELLSRRQQVEEQQS